MIGVKKKNFLLLISILLLQLSLGSCNTVYKEQEPGAISVNYQIASPQSRECRLEEDEGRVDFQFEIENGDASAEWGVLLFLNGYFQPYSVDGHEAVPFYTKQFASQESAVLNISFAPVTGEQGEECRLQLVVMLNPSYRTEDGDFLFNHSLSQIQPWTVLLNDTAPSLPKVYKDYETKVTEKAILEDYGLTAQDGDQSDAEGKNIYIRILKEEGEEGVLFCEEGECRFQIESFGRVGNYRLSLFCNQKPLPMKDGAYYNDIQIENGKTTFVSVAVKPENLEEINSLYAIAAPIPSGEGSEEDMAWDIVKSPSVLLRRGA